MLSREDGEASQNSHPEILRFAQDDGELYSPSFGSTVAAAVSASEAAA
jgi:hypothetical protein